MKTKRECAIEAVEAMLERIQNEDLFDLSIQVSEAKEDGSVVVIEMFAQIIGDADHDYDVDEYTHRITSYDPKNVRHGGELRAGLHEDIHFNYLPEVQMVSNIESEGRKVICVLFKDKFVTNDWTSSSYEMKDDPRYKNARIQFEKKVLEELQVPAEYVKPIEIDWITEQELWVGLF